MANSNSLSEHYKAKGMPLPSIGARAKLYETMGLGPAASYVGSTQQNQALLQKLDAPPPRPARSNSLIESALKWLKSVFTTLDPRQPCQPCPHQNAKNNPSSSEAGELGSLSKRYESGSNGPGTVSSGSGDSGGVSYGTYQLASNLGRPQAFLKDEGSQWAPLFEGKAPGSSEFSEVWKKVAEENPEEFGAAQHAYIQRTHYDPSIRKILDDTGLDVTKRSATVQDVVWSTAVQHGPHNNIVKNALGDHDPADISDEELIKAIYAERGRTTPDGNLVHFSKNSSAVQKGVQNRFIEEEAEALRRLNL